MRSARPVQNDYVSGVVSWTLLLSWNYIAWRFLRFFYILISTL